MFESMTLTTGLAAHLSLKFVQYFDLYFFYSESQSSENLSPAKSQSSEISLQRKSQSSRKIQVNNIGQTLNLDAQQTQCLAPPTQIY